MTQKETGAGQREFENKIEHGLRRYGESTDGTNFEVYNDAGQKLGHILVDDSQYKDGKVVFRIRSIVPTKPEDKALKTLIEQVVSGYCEKKNFIYSTESKFKKPDR